MRGFRGLFFILALVALFGGCEKKDYTKEAAKMHWDRDMCERCKMAISDRKFAVQAVDAQGKVYKFDDIGCLILWHKKEHPEIVLKKIWVTDAKTGEWIDAKRACYTTDNLTPMGYGFGAHKKAPPNKRCISFAEVEKEMEGR